MDSSDFVELYEGIPDPSSLPFPPSHVSGQQQIGAAYPYPVGREPLPIEIFRALMGNASTPLIRPSDYRRLPDLGNTSRSQEAWTFLGPQEEPRLLESEKKEATGTPYLLHLEAPYCLINRQYSLLQRGTRVPTGWMLHRQYLGIKIEQRAAGSINVRDRSGNTHFCQEVPDRPSFWKIKASSRQGKRPRTESMQHQQQQRPQQHRQQQEQLNPAQHQMAPDLPQSALLPHLRSPHLMPPGAAPRVSQQGAMMHVATALHGQPGALHRSSSAPQSGALHQPLSFEPMPSAQADPATHMSAGTSSSSSSAPSSFAASAAHGPGQHQLHQIRLLQQLQHGSLLQLAAPSMQPPSAAPLQVQHVSSLQPPPAASLQMQHTAPPQVQHVAPLQPAAQQQPLPAAAARTLQDTGHIPPPPPFLAALFPPMREHTPQEVLAGQLSQAVATWADHPENLLKWQLNGPRPPSRWHPEGKEGFARMGHVAVAPSLEAARAGLHVEVCDGVPESWTILALDCLRTHLGREGFETLLCQQDDRGNTPLHWASRFGGNRLGVLQWLLGHTPEAASGLSGIHPHTPSLRMLALPSGSGWLSLHSLVRQTAELVRVLCAQPDGGNHVITHSSTGASISNLRRACQLWLGAAEQQGGARKLEAILFNLDSEPWKRYDCTKELQVVCSEYKGGSYSAKQALSKGQLRALQLEEELKNLSVSS